MSSHITKQIAQTDIIAIIRGINPDATIETIDALQRGGISVIEITANTDRVLEMLRDVSSTFTADEVTIGTGTVLDGVTARVAMFAGAEFIVTPSVDEETIRTANRYGIPSIVGVATPTEAIDAYKTGASMIKAFPASTLGPEFVSSLQGPIGHIPIVPTGGISLDNIDAFLTAGASAVGVGSSLVDSSAIENKEYDQIEANARTFVEAIADVRDE